MSIQSEIERITGAVGMAYDAVAAKGGTVPQNETVAGLAEAVNTIPTSSAAAPLIVNFTLGDAVGGGFRVTPDVTADEIIAAAQSGRVVQACINLDDQLAFFFPLTAWRAGESGGEPTICFDMRLWNQDELDATIFGSYMIRYMHIGSLAQGWYFSEVDTEQLKPVGGGGNNDGKVLLAYQMNWGMSEYVLDDHINDLIDAKLGGIENGAY